MPDRQLAGWVFVLDNLNMHCSVTLVGYVTELEGSRRVMRRGNFKSLEDLNERLTDFIGYFNQTFAKPFEWKYTGRPAQINTVKRPSTWKENWATSRTSTQTSAVVA